MKVVEHSSGGIGLMIKESDLRVVQLGGLNHISNNLRYIIFSIRFYLKEERCRFHALFMELMIVTDSSYNIRMDQMDYSLSLVAVNFRYKVIVYYYILIHTGTLKIAL